MYDINQRKPLCDRCRQRESMHSEVRQGSYYNYCCQCHVDKGNAPSSWHPECMRAAANTMDD